MPKLTKQELDEWTARWRARIDSLLSSPTAGQSISSGQSVPVSESAVAKYQLNYGKKCVEVCSDGISNLDYMNEAGRHQDSVHGGKGVRSRQEELRVEMAHSEPDGREV